jgi:hypothetical protein
LSRCLAPLSRALLAPLFSPSNRCAEDLPSKLRAKENSSSPPLRPTTNKGWRKKGDVFRLWIPRQGWCLHAMAWSHLRSLVPRVSSHLITLNGSHNAELRSVQCRPTASQRPPYTSPSANASHTAQLTRAEVKRCHERQQQLSLHHLASVDLRLRHIKQSAMACGHDWAQSLTKIHRGKGKTGMDAAVASSLAVSGARWVCVTCRRCRVGHPHPRVVASQPRHPQPRCGARPPKGRQPHSGKGGGWGGHPNASTRRPHQRPQQSEAPQDTAQKDDGRRTRPSLTRKRRTWRRGERRRTTAAHWTTEPSP